MIIHKTIEILKNTYSVIKFRKFISKGTRVHYRSKITGDVQIGTGTNINGYAFIDGYGASVDIGNYCAIAHNFRIRTRNHDVTHLILQDRLQRKITGRIFGIAKGPTTIGHGCWIGDNVTILPGVTIGNGAVIGAGSVVTKDVPAFSIAAGVPAKVLHYRFPPSSILKLNKLNWHNMSLKQMRENVSLFENEVESAEFEKALELFLR